MANGLLSTIDEWRRQRQLRDILSQSIRPATPTGVPTDPSQYTDAPDQPYLTNPEQPARVDLNSALPELARQGLGPEALGLINQQAELGLKQQEVNNPLAVENLKAAAARQQLAIEYQLKRALEQGRMQDAQNMIRGMSGPNLNGATSMEITPQGPKINFDPSKAATQARDDAKAQYEFGYNPAGASAPVSPGQSGQPNQQPAAAGVTPKAAADIAAKRAQEMPLDENKINNTSFQLDRLAEGARALLNHPGLDSSTGFSAALGYVPNTDAYNFRVALQTLKNKIAFGALAAMKDASENGSSGLGRITNNEMNMLQGNIDALDRGQDPETIRKSLQNVINFAAGSKKQIMDSYKNIYGVMPRIQPYTPSGVGAGQLPAASPQQGQWRVIR